MAPIDWLKFGTDRSLHSSDSRSIKVYLACVCVCVCALECVCVDMWAKLVCACVYECVLLWLSQNINKCLLAYLAPFGLRTENTGPRLKLVKWCFFMEWAKD